MKSGVWTVHLGVLLAGGLVGACAHTPSTPASTSAAGSSEGGVAAPAGAAGDVLLEEGAYVFETRSSWTRSYRLHTRCRNEACLAEEAAIQYFYDPRWEDRPKIVLRFRRPDGTIGELASEAFSEQEIVPQDSSSTSPLRRIEGRLSGARVGDVIELEIESRRLRSAFSAPTAARFLMGQYNRGAKVSLTLSVPESLPLAWKTVALELTPKETVKDGMRTVVFATDSPPLYESRAAYEAGPRQFLPAVHFSVGGGWAEVAAALEPTLSAATALEPAAKKRLKDEVKTWTRGAKTPLQRLARVVRGLHQAVRINGDGFDSTEPALLGPVALLERGHGSALERAVLLKSLLAVMELPSELVLIQKENWEEFHPKLAGLDVFDHVLLRVAPPAKGEAQVWIDPGSRWESIGTLPQSSANRSGLLLSAGTQELIRTPRPTSKEARYVEVRTYRLQDLGLGSIEEISTATGWIASSQRRHFEEQQPTQRQNWAHKYLAEVYQTDSVDTLMVEGVEALEQPLYLRLEGSGSKICDTVIHEAAVQLSGLGLWVPFPGEMLDEAQKLSPETPLNFPMPFSSRIENHIRFPVGFQVAALPENQSWSFGSATLSREVRVEKEEIVVALEFDTGVGALTAGELIAIDEQSGRLLPADGWIRFEVEGITLLKAGKTREGIETLVRLREPRQDSLSVGLRWVMGLNLTSLGFAARAAAEDLAKAHPKSHRAHLVLAQTLERSVIGELWGDGFDYEGALAAYRKGVKLAPEDTFLRRRLALLLERDRDGIRRVVPSPELTEAIALQQGLMKDGDEALAANLVGNLYWAGKLKETVAFAEAHPKVALASNFRRAALAILHPERDAVLEAAAELGVAGDAQRAQYLAQITLFLLAREALEPALAFARAAAASPQATPQAHTLVRMIEGYQKPNPSIQALPEEVREAFGDFESLLESGGVEKYLKRFDSMTPEDRERAEASLRGATDDQGAPLREQRRGMDRTIGVNFSLKTLWRLSRAAIYAEAEGSKEGGYRLSIQAPGAKSRLMTFIAPTKGGLVISLQDPLPSSLEKEIVRLDREGFDAAVPLYLGWLAELLEKTSSIPILHHPWGTSRRLGVVWKEGLLDTPEGVRLARAVVVGKEDPKWIAKQTPEAQAAIALNRIDQLGSAGKSDKDWKRIIALAKKVEGPEVARKWARKAEAIALGNLGRHTEALTLWQALAEEDPKDRWAFEGVTRSRLAMGLDKEVLELAVSLWEKADKPPAWLNKLAWMALIVGEPVDLWLQRLQLHPNAPWMGSATIHTEASLLAEIGRYPEALARLGVSMKKRNAREPSPSDWYVLGRIAQGYGIRSAAREAYEKVIAAQGDSPMDTAVLARRQLEEMKPR